MTTETLYATAEAAQEATLAERTATYLETLNRKTGDYATFTLDRPGRKFTRVVMDTGGQYGKSVHAFLDHEGGVYKPAGWKAPASGVRFNLLDDQSFEALLDQCAFAGGYLYRRGGR